MVVIALLLAVLIKLAFFSTVVFWTPAEVSALSSYLTG
jgi:hypothetical protein